MKKIIRLFVALVAVIMVASCAGKKSLDVLGGEWRVVSVGNLSVPDSVDAFIGFNLTEHVVYGSTGCNFLTGSLPENSAEPLFAAMGSTQRMCADMTIEQAMLPALGQVADFMVEGDNLYLLDASGVKVLSLARR